MEMYPLVMTNIAVEHGHRNSELSHYCIFLFSIVMFVYQGVSKSDEIVCVCLYIDKWLGWDRIALDWPGWD